MSSQHFDVIIIGAGLSGIGTACHIAKECPNKSLAMIERRESMGGTWDLFRYPGIRSDSDMTSFGFKFKPWFSNKVLARGKDIRHYVKETAEEFGIYDNIHFGLKVTDISWSSSDQQWTITATKEATGETETFTCSMISNCSGYYSYEGGYTPDFEGMSDFNGQILHPQEWPEDLDYSDKKVVIIGSGATAITMVPSMAGTAKHVTMLQRSPTYLMALPDTDTLSMFLGKFFSKETVFRMARKRNILFQRALYMASVKWPNFMRKVMLKHVKKRLAPHIDMKHFTPKYNPWEERLCAAPDGDFFDAVNSGQASVETDQVARFVSDGIELKSGKKLEADIVVTATGFNVQLLGGAKLNVDGQEVKMSDKLVYKSVFIQDLPNFAWIFGYTNAPWTLKSDIAGQYMCRLIKYMDTYGYKVATPVDEHNSASPEGILDAFSPGYVQRAKHVLPRQGKTEPWRLNMHYGKDKKVLTKDPIADGIMKFQLAAEKPVEQTPPTERDAA